MIRDNFTGFIVMVQIPTTKYQGNSLSNVKTMRLTGTTFNVSPVITSNHQSLLILQRCSNTYPESPRMITLSSTFLRDAMILSDKKRYQQKYKFNSYAKDKTLY